MSAHVDVDYDNGVWHGCYGYERDLGLHVPVLHSLWWYKFVFELVYKSATAENQLLSILHVLTSVRMCNIT